MEKISTDRKLALIQDIRQQNQYNRMKCRERERFLYGSSAEELPYGELHSAETASLKGSLGGAPVYQESRGTKGFKIRLLFAVMLFCAFIFLEYSSSKVYNLTADDLYEKLTENMDVSAFL